MRYPIIVVLMITAMSVFSFAAEDTVYLKSGEKIEGMIFKEGGINVYLIADTEVGLVAHTVLQDDIERIEYAQSAEEKQNQDKSAELMKRYREFQRFYRAGNKAFQKKDYYDAMESYRQAVEFDPKSPQAYYNLGMVYVNLGYSSRARESFQSAGRLVKLIPNPSEKEQDLIANIEKALQSLQ